MCQGECGLLRIYWFYIVFNDLFFYSKLVPNVALAGQASRSGFTEQFGSGHLGGSCRVVGWNCNLMTHWGPKSLLPRCCTWPAGMPQFLPGKQEGDLSSSAWGSVCRAAHSRANWLCPGWRIWARGTQNLVLCWGGSVGQSKGMDTQSWQSEAVLVIEIPG